MADDGDAPGAPQHPLPLHPAHVVHICVVFGESKDPGEEEERGEVASNTVIVSSKDPLTEGFSTLWVTKCQKPISR